MNVLDLQPSLLWKYFNAICQIPHPSKHEEKILAYIENIAAELGVNCKKDNTGNLLISKPASAGKENSKTIVLQAHVDMVPQKNESTTHNFETDPLKIYEEDGWVKATDTTLGADNGIAVAAMLAILEDKSLVHGPIQALFTVDEETGMTGAFGLKPGFVEGDILLNMDTEDEGTLCIGCAGGINTTGTLTYEPDRVPAGCQSFEIAIKGLKGGHSGVDIHLGRANANKEMNRLLADLQETLDISISTIRGGSLRNAIPRESFVKIVVPNDNSNQLIKKIDAFKEQISSEYSGIEDDIRIELKPTDCPAEVLPKKVQTALLNTIFAIDNGVFRYVPEMPEVVETSNNIAKITVGGGNAEILCLVRSSSESMKKNQYLGIESALKLGGFSVVHDGDYPGWKPDFNSTILKTMKKVHQDFFKKEAIIEVVHAGLECGIIGAVYPNMELISFGPTIKHPHSPDEKVDVKTVENFWFYLLKTLEEIN